MITINGYDWSIEFVEPNNEVLLKPDGTYTVGCTDSSTLTIYLSDLLFGDFLKKVCCHEICHAFCFSYSIEMSVDEEERLCDFIATYGVEVIELADLVYRMIKRVA